MARFHEPPSDGILATGSVPVERTYLRFGRRDLLDRGAIARRSAAPSRHGSLRLYIGLELGIAYRKLGAAVTLVLGAGANLAALWKLCAGECASQA